MNNEKRHILISAIAWLAVLLCYAYSITLDSTKIPTTDCQSFDRFGRGIGCDEQDLGDL
jgi:hypothetical protein